jgi:hypothetical protein
LISQIAKVEGPEWISQASPKVEVVEGVSLTGAAGFTSPAVGLPGTSEVLPALRLSIALWTCLRCKA